MRICSPTSRSTRWGRGWRTTSCKAQARGDEFRTAPLWGLGQRIFFLHDGRTSDLRAAIAAHRSSGNSQFGPSEANEAISHYNSLELRATGRTS